MHLRFGISVIPPEVDLGTRTMVNVAINLMFYATVSESRHMLGAFFVWPLVNV